MKISSIVGIIFIALGVIGLTVGGLSFTSEKHEAKVGPIEATVKEKKEIPIPPIAGGAALIAGVVILAVGKGQKET